MRGEGDDVDLGQTQLAAVLANFSFVRALERIDRRDHGGHFVGREDAAQPAEAELIELRVLLRREDPQPVPRGHGPTEIPVQRVALQRRGRSRIHEFRAWVGWRALYLKSINNAF